MKLTSLLFPAILMTLPLAAQEEPASPTRDRESDPVAEAVRALKSGEALDAANLAAILPLMAEPGGRTAIRRELLLRDPFPAGALVEGLSHPQLAVRLGAIELLEEKANGDFGFNPWLAPGQPANAGPLARWMEWTSDDRDGEADASLLSEDQRRGYLRDLLGEDHDKAARARRMLEADGIGSVGFLEGFLGASPALPDGSRARVRQAQYQIVLSRPLGEQAANTARQLAFGSRDQVLASLGSLRNAGLAALPILRDFLQHPDPLVRESAIDAMLASGGAQSLDVVAPVLREETDVNVIHGALRRLRDISGEESARLVADFLSHDDEDLLVSAIQTALKLVGGGNSYSPFNSSPRAKPTGIAAEIDAAVLGLLDDPRWRVRTAALEFIADRRMDEAKEKVVALLEDPDEFVRYRAIRAAALLRADDAPPKLKRMFLDNPDVAGPVLGAYSSLGLEPDAEMLAALDRFPPEARLATIRAAEEDSDLAPLVLRFAADPDLDVACAALRFLGADEDEVAKDSVATALLDALDEDSPEKRRAVLDRLDLPNVKATDPAVAEILSEFASSPEGSSLDPLYEAFVGTSPAGDEKGRELHTIPGAAGKLVERLGTIATDASEDSFRAALVLAESGYPSGLKALIDRVPELSTAQKSAIAESLYNPSQREAVELLRLLIRDPVSEIREAAVKTAFSNENAPAFASMVFQELAQPGSKLAAHELYSYQFENATDDGASSRAARNWALGVIGDPELPAPVRVLALVGLRNSFPPSAAQAVGELAAHAPDPWIRRAAFYTLGRSSPSAFRSLLPELLADRSPQVRAVLPEVVGRMPTRWAHRFDDTHEAADDSYDSGRDRRRMPGGAADALESMARTDPSPENRFEASFALLSHGREIDADAFASLLPRQPEDARASYRVASWMNRNSNRIGPGLAPVIAALDTAELDPSWIQSIAASLNRGGGGSAGFASFSALVAQDESARSGSQQTDEEESPAEEPERQALKLVYFLKTGCQECARASALLDDFKDDFPLLAVEEFNISEASSIVLNQALCNRFDVPSNKHNLAPALFTQAGFLVKDDISPQALGDLLANTLKQPEDDSWSEVGQPAIAAAAEEVKRKAEALTLSVVIGGGLADGVNPCAFATIIFFLSYLQVARRTPREMLMVGAAFILAVFLAYFAAGLALHGVLAALTDKFQGIQRWLNGIFGSLALVAALLSFRDAWLARQGRAEDMTLQLPGFLKDRIRGVIRGGARARRFVIAAFFAGIVISFLELACTGQVYAPIIYQIQQGSADAVGMLLIYNLAFILPLGAVFLATWAGFSVNALVHLQKRFTTAVKILLGLLFLFLAAIMFFGSSWLSR